MADFDLKTLVICPNRVLAAEFERTISVLRSFQILADLKSYPNAQAIEMRLRQLEPDVVLLDIASDPVRAGDLIETISAHPSNVAVVGLHVRNDAEAILAALRRGACEFLYAPFDLQIQQEAVSRLRRMRRPVEIAPDRDTGFVIGVSSAKPGSGATTVALELAQALERQAQGRVLLIDADLAAGTLGMTAARPAEDNEDHSLAAVLSGETGPNWHRATRKAGGIEILPAPPNPRPETPDLTRLAEALEAARRAYDWVVIDLPVVFDRLSLMTVSVADCFYLVSTGELASLHLARRALGLLQTLGFGPSSARTLVNRTSKRDGLQLADFQKIFGTPVEALLPEDAVALDKRSSSSEGIAAGPSGGEFSKAVAQFAGRLAKRVAEDRRPVPAGAVGEPAPARAG